MELETDTSFSHHQICTYSKLPDWCVTVFWQHCTQEVFQLKNNNNKMHTKPISGDEERTRDKENRSHFDSPRNASGLPAPDTAFLGALISPWVFPGSFQPRVFFERWFVFPVYKRTTMFRKSRKSRTVVKLSPLLSPCQLPLVSLNLNGGKKSVYPVQNPFNQVFYTKRRIITWHGASDENHPLQTHVLEHPLVVALVEKVLETLGEAPLGVEVCHCGQALRFWSLVPLSVLSVSCTCDLPLCFLAAWQD